MGARWRKKTPRTSSPHNCGAQGYACDHPTNVTRNSGASKPNETVWVIVCEHATYRAKLVPKMAAEVEVLSENEKSSSAPR